MYFAWQVRVHPRTSRRYVLARRAALGNITASRNVRQSTIPAARAQDVFHARTSRHSVPVVSDFESCAEWENSYRRYLEGLCRIHRMRRLMKSAVDFD